MRASFSAMMACYFLLLPADIAAEDDWWQMIQRAGSACFSGRNWKVEIVAGIGSKTLGEVARSGPFSEIRISVPLFNSKERQEEKQKLASFLEHSSEILGQLEQAKALVRVKTEEAAVLRGTMLQSGQAGISGWFAIKSELAILETTAKAAEMKLNGFLKACEVEK